MKPALKLVGGTDKAKRAANPDAELKRLLRRRLALKLEIAKVEGALFDHRRRKADERGLIPPLSLDDLIAELVK